MLIAAVIDVTPAGIERFRIYEELVLDGVELTQRAFLVDDVI